jgi:hypothetical protein
MLGNAARSFICIWFFLCVFFALRPALAARSDFAAIDARASTVPVTACDSVTTLGLYLGSLSPDPELKARAIYAWITANIKYERLIPTTRIAQDATTVLQRRMGVCEGYSRLFQALAEAAGLEAVVIAGEAKYGNSTLRERHAWNAVKLNGKWELLDCTWGAGFQDPGGQFVKGRPDFYFLTPPTIMLESHLPDDTTWQLLDAPITKDEFERRVCLNTNFFELGFTSVSERNQVITTEKATLEIRVKAPIGTGLQSILCNSMSEIAGSTLTQREGNDYVVQIALPEPGRYTLRLMGWKTDGTNRVAYNLLDYTIITTAGTPIRYPDLQTDFQIYGCHLAAPYVRTLPVGQEVFFDITAPDATEVGIALMDDKELQSLPKEAGRFAGKAKFERAGKGVIWAKFPGEGSYSGLVVYEVAEQPKSISMPALPPENVAADSLSTLHIP